MMVPAIVDEAGKHLQINDIRTDDAEAAYAFWQSLRDRYLGYTVDFCFHDGNAPVALMAELGMSPLESCVETRLFRENFTHSSPIEATLVTRGGFSAFHALHDRASGGMYWTSNRIAEDPSRWCIYMLHASYVLMCMADNMAEVYALSASDCATGAALLSHAAEFAFDRGKPYALYMVDDDAPVERESARRAGFVETGRYAAYRGVVQ